MKWRLLIGWPSTEATPFCRTSTVCAQNILESNERGALFSHSLSLCPPLSVPLSQRRFYYIILTFYVFQSVSLFLSLSVFLFLSFLFSYVFINFNLNGSLSVCLSSYSYVKAPYFFFLFLSLSFSHTLKKLAARIFCSIKSDSLILC